MSAFGPETDFDRWRFRKHQNDDVFKMYWRLAFGQSAY
jgi:hypothetical protein